MVYRIYVERRPGFLTEYERTVSDLRENLGLPSLPDLRIINRYDIEGVDEETVARAKYTVFAEPQTDVATESLELGSGTAFAVEYLPGQYDQRADSCAQCVQLLTCGDRPTVRTAKIYLFDGKVSDEDLSRIKGYIINPVESREATFDLPESLKPDYDIPTTVATLNGFIGLDDEGLRNFVSEYSLAMDYDDIKFCQGYFRDTEHRDPTISELRLIDSYWSDHCRHTTFLTEITDAKISEDYIAETYRDYLDKRAELYVGKNKKISLMDLATIGAKYLKKTGQLDNLDESDEINACTVKIKAKIDGKEEDWLLLFKNETHNHPTEIEPFGGAATCLGGAIRDPLSGRAYVYQAMRVTGAADPRTSLEDTLPGKLPQSKITVGAAQGYSSYGNQIGLATGGVFEHYHPGYVAKRLEIGAVVGAAPAGNVRREVPAPGDVVILLGGRTGRDGCGGATGSSKAHTTESLTSCGAEVQKGNPPEERKLQRLFRSPEASLLIKRCNDFGAGGVSVAIGELADGLRIDLSKVPKKYDGLDGTELAISESQERMAVVVEKKDVEKFCALAAEENLESTVVAEVTEDPRLVMVWNGNTTVDLSREFLNSNGAAKTTTVEVSPVEEKDILRGIDLCGNTIGEKAKALMEDLNVCSKRGLCERFDSSIGGATVVMPFGGKTQLTQPQYMAAKLPVISGECETASFMAYGFDPYLSSSSPFHGALYAVVESVARLVAAGQPYQNAYLTFQEYFERTKNTPTRWGKPFAALLGAYRAQIELGLGSIGGKDSMSGTFENIDVPPTLVSFAVAAGDASSAVTPEFKAAGNNVYLMMPEYLDNGLPSFESLKALFDKVHAITASGKAASVYTVGFGGALEATAKMCFGNKIGFKFEDGVDSELIRRRLYGSFVIETSEELDGIKLGVTTDAPVYSIGGEDICLCEMIGAWEKPLESVFRTKAKADADTAPVFTCTERSAAVAGEKFAKPRIMIPVFPGTNCEYDTARAFIKAGGDPMITVLCNGSSSALEGSIDKFVENIKKAQIFMIPGGFSGGDEPDGSGKFITAVLRSPKVKEALTDLIENRDGLVLGICNGFQALVKVGLLPYGKILDELTPDCPTLTYNTIGRHQSRMVNTRIASVKSPWLAGVNAGDIHAIPISHGEGRFMASPELLDKLAANGQIATQYVDFDGNPSMDIRFNPNGSAYAIEGILSSDGRILGKMGHSERIGNNVAVNIPGNQDQKLFESGVKYFK